MHLSVYLLAINFYIMNIIKNASETTLHISLKWRYVATFSCNFSGNFDDDNKKYTSPII